MDEGEVWGAWVKVTCVGECDIWVYVGEDEVWGAWIKVMFGCVWA